MKIQDLSEETLREMLKKATGTLYQLKYANRLRSQNTFGHTVEDWSLPEWGNAVAGETGEMCNIVKKVHRGDMTLEEANEKELIANEAADMVIYLDMLCQRAGIDLNTAIVNKFNQVSEERGSDVKIYYY